MSSNNIITFYNFVLSISALSYCPISLFLVAHMSYSLTSCIADFYLIVVTRKHWLNVAFSADCIALGKKPTSKHAVF